MKKIKVISLVEGIAPPFPKFLLHFLPRLYSKYWFNNFQQELVETPKHIEHNVLIKTIAVAVCATDIAILSDRRRFAGQMLLGKKNVAQELRKRYLGHEVIGTIIDKGNDVQDLEIGDRVVV